MKEELQIFWKNLYKKYFNIDIDASSIKELKGKWAIFIAKELTIQQVFDVLPFRKWKYTDEDLDIEFSINERALYKDYVVYVDKSIEADESFKKMSSYDLKIMNHKGITLLERLLLELFYFEKTGKNLDINSVTLCSGSSNSNGDIPRVDWTGVKLRLSWVDPSFWDSRLRSRKVSFKK